MLIQDDHEQHRTITTIFRSKLNSKILLISDSMELQQVLMRGLSEDDDGLIQAEDTLSRQHILMTESIKEADRRRHGDHGQDK